jgi:hypothetical protein
MKLTTLFALGTAIVMSMTAIADAQSALGGDTQSIGGFGGESFISGDQTADATSQAILQQATGTTGSAFATGTGGSIFGEGAGGVAGTNSLNTLGTLGALGFGRTGGGAGGFGGRGQQGLNQLGNTGTSTPIRVPIRLSAELSSFRAASQTTRATAFEKRLTKLPGFAKTSSVSVVLEGRTAILQGAVATERQRGLIQRLVMLEPGVSGVRNDLTVGPSLEPEALPLP